MSSSKEVGYFGRRCDTSLCDTSNPCLHNSTCTMNPSGAATCTCLKNETGEWVGETCSEFEASTSVGRQVFGAFAGLAATGGLIYFLFGYCKRRGQLLLAKNDSANIKHQKNVQQQNKKNGNRQNANPARGRESRGTSQKFKTVALRAAAANRIERGRDDNDYNNNNKLL